MAAALVGSLAMAAQPAFAAQGAAGAAPRVSATLLACNPAALQADRSATFGGQMRSASGARTMQIRFELQQSTPAHRAFQDLALPGGSASGFGAWQTSQPNIALLSNTQTVTGLAAPASYRVIVHFRWLTAARRVLRTAQRTTPVCRMADPRPNLAVDGLEAVNGGSAYDVIVRNRGAGAAPAVQVTLGVAGGAPPATQTLAALAPGASALLRFPAPACTAGQSVTVVIDPLGTVNETTTADNRRSAAC